METLADDLLTGAGAIANELGWKPRKVYALAERGAIPVFKVGGVLHARRSELRKRLSAERELA